jgi:hypothetical protein
MQVVETLIYKLNLEEPPLLFRVEEVLLHHLLVLQDLLHLPAVYLMA